MLCYSVLGTPMEPNMCRHLRLVEVHVFELRGRTLENYTFCCVLVEPSAHVRDCVLKVHFGAR